MSFLILPFIVATALALYELQASRKPAFCEECGHCRQRRAEEERQQAALAEDYARRMGLRDEDENRSL
ncbi:MAG TPA: hypothetical protein VFK38_09295 [Candidatus Limnocylindrales bacterium]|nr:hypothetical protein [Candidatus Limnocylindrales bacterium]